MKTVIYDVISVYEYSTERQSWRNEGGRKYHILSYQLDGCYEHTLNGRSLTVSADTVFFINQADSYSVRCIERGRSLCVSFLADTDLSTSVFAAADDPRLLGIFKRLLSLGALELESNKYLAASRVYELLSELCRRRDTAYLPRGTRDRLRAAHAYLLENYRRRDFDVNALAELVGVGQKQLTRLFRAEYGATPTQYVIGLRMSAAAHLIEEGYMSISEIAALVGYDDVFYFSRLFKKHFSVSPSRYRDSRTAPR